MKIEIPSFLSHLPVDERGYPIPYFVPVEKGKPNFRLLSQKKQELCFKNDLCGICGKKLVKDSYYIIGGPKTLASAVTVDPFMHKDCATYSMGSCPHMFYERTKRADMDEVYDPGTMDLDKPPMFYLIRSDKKLKFNIINNVLHYNFRVHSYIVYYYHEGVLTTSGEFIKR